MSLFAEANAILLAVENTIARPKKSELEGLVAIPRVEAGFGLSTRSRKQFSTWKSVLTLRLQRENCGLTPSG